MCEVVQNTNKTKHEMIFFLSVYNFVLIYSNCTSTSLLFISVRLDVFSIRFIRTNWTSGMCFWYFRDTNASTASSSEGSFTMKPSKQLNGRKRCSLTFSSPERRTSPQHFYSAHLNQGDAWECGRVKWIHCFWFYSAFYDSSQHVSSVVMSL